MKYTTTSIAAATLALASASPLTAPSPETCGVPTNPNGVTLAHEQVFQLFTLPNTGNTILCNHVQGKNNTLVVGAKTQGAKCERGVPAKEIKGINYANFQLTYEGDLFLLSGDNTGFPTQQVYVDPSADGQGQIGFTTGKNQTTEKTWERGPFKINKDDDLVFHDKSGNEIAFQACPGKDGTGEDSYLLWLQGKENPAGSTGCVKVAARAVVEANPFGCNYTVQRTYTDTIITTNQLPNPN
jgi:hypothetical protein